MSSIPEGKTLLRYILCKYVYVWDRYIKPSTALARAFKRKNESKQQVDSDEEDDEDNEDGEVKAEKPAPRNKSSLQQLAEEALADMEQDEKNKKHTAMDEKDAKTRIVITVQQITLAHSAKLQEFLSWFDVANTKSDVILDHLCDILPAFGCTSYAVQDLTELRTQYKYLQHSKESWKVRIAEFATRHPYAYCLLQVKNTSSSHMFFQSFPKFIRQLGDLYSGCAVFASLNYPRTY